MSTSTSEAPTEYQASFSRLLRSAPTAAIDSYRSLYTSRNSSASGESDFVAATQVLASALSFKDWETCTTADRLEMTRNDLLQTCNASVESLSADIWDALVATKLPLFWLDVALQENPVHSRIMPKIFYCLVPFTFIWLRELEKVRDERRDYISASFAGVCISKFIDLYSVFWMNREPLKQRLILDVFGRLAYDLTRIHAHYDLPKQQLANGKVAHLVLFTVSTRERLLLTYTASSRDLEAFKTVSSAVMSTRGQTAHHSWIQELVKAVGPQDLMDALGTVIFHPSITDVTLATFASTIITMIYNVPECLAVVYRDPLGHTQRCARALERQLVDKTQVPVLKWAQDIVVWENLYRLCLLPHDDLFMVRPEHIHEYAYMLFGMQSRGISVVLDILQQKPGLMLQWGGEPTTVAMDLISERLGVAYDETLSWLTNNQAGVQEKEGSAMTFQRVYADQAREGWLHTAKLLREVQPQHSHEPAYKYLAQYWVEIGRYVGVRDAAGLLQLDRACSNPSCQHHLVPVERSLSVCKGCQEARYCSRECQRSDWKGRHRAQCRRVKEAGS